MKKIEMVKLALRAIDKGWDFDELKYGDDLYGKESFAHEIWVLVDECKLIGTKAFSAKYTQSERG